MFNRKYLIEALGWSGASLTLLAFALNSLKQIGSQSITYLLMNVIGCAFLILYTYQKKAYANTVLNSIWMGISLVAMINYYVLN